MLGKILHSKTATFLPTMMMKPVYTRKTKVHKSLTAFDRNRSILNQTSTAAGSARRSGNSRCGNLCWPE